MAASGVRRMAGTTTSRTSSAATIVAPGATTSTNAPSVVSSVSSYTLSRSTRVRRPRRRSPIRVMGAPPAQGRPPLQHRWRRAAQQHRGLKSEPQRASRAAIRERVAIIAISELRCLPARCHRRMRRSRTCGQCPLHPAEDVAPLDRDPGTNRYRYASSSARWIAASDTAANAFPATRRQERLSTRSI